MLNVQMMGHQRDILATMGIDIWIPQHAARLQQSPSSTLWRDQALPEPLPELPQTVLASPELVTPQKQDIAVELTQFIEVEPEQNRAEQLIAPQPPELQPEPAIQIAAFAIQAISLTSCTILLDTSSLTEAQAELWLNIQQAIPAEFAELKWPFPLAEMQDGRGASCYVQGFVDAISVGKDLIALGEVPYLQQADVHRLAGLQEMLDQPILKKRLWQFMQKSLNTRMPDE